MVPHTAVLKTQYSFVETRTNTAPSIDHLLHLPAFASFLLNHKLETFVKKQLQYAYDLKVPMLHFFANMSEAEVFDLGLQTNRDLLGNLAANKASVQIQRSMQQWKENELLVVDKDSIAADDILLVSHIRKKAMLDLLTDYTTDPQEMVALIKEIDLFSLRQVSEATQQYMDLQRQRLEENSLFTQKVAETIPGAIYVFDAEQYKGIYSNNKLPEVIGYTQNDLNALGENTIAALVHPDDQALLKNQLETVRTSANDVPSVVKYRIRTPDGNYKWLANYESVFKRKESGAVWQTIGITLDVDKEQNAIGQLYQREQERSQLLQKLAEADARHKQAEAIAHIGTYSRNLHTGEIDWSDEMYRIYEVTQGEKVDYALVLAFIHPHDKDFFAKAIDESIQKSKAFDFYYRIKTSGGNTKIIHSKGDVKLNKEGRPERLVGTIQDVTEKQGLIRQLQKSESLYQQAEAIADMGNWNWDLRTGKLEWTDQLYRIYGLEPQSEEITIDRFLDFVHPNDRDVVEKGVNKLNSEDVLDYTFRIVTGDGTDKWLRSIAQVLRNDDGQPVYVIGTEQNVSEKELLINRLQESERLYKQAQSLAIMGNWSYDLVSGMVSWSDELYGIYELPRDIQPTPEDWDNFVSAEERATVYAQMQIAVAEGKPMDNVHHITLPNGKTKILHRRGEVIYDHTGKAIKIVGTTQDVTQQYQIQSKLKDSQNLIQKITDATPAIIVTYNVHTGLYTYVSEGLEKILGYTVEEVMEKGTAFFLQIIHPDDRGAVMEKNRKALAEANVSPNKKGLVVEFRYRLKHRDGSYRWFHTYGTIFDTDAKGGVEHVLNITLDVTDQKEAIETIREQEYFIQQIADASPTILYLFDAPTQSVAYINREAFFVLGYLPEEILEQSSMVTTQLYHPDEWHLLPARKQSGKTFQQTDSMIQYECRMKHKDGDYRWLLVREIVFKTDDNGDITQIIGAALDITRRKEMERTILQNAHQLEQSNASLEEFAYIASHDLKEPLRKISTFGDRLVASQMDKLSDDGKIYLTKIVDASQRMQNMISDLLSISMISGNKGFEQVSLQKLLEETLQTLEYKIEQQNAVIKFEPLPEAAVVASQFRQLFQNLISNSLKFVREGVQPVISIACQWFKPEEVSAFSLRKAPAYLQLRFSDNGIGFETEYAQKIFAIFQRLHGRSEYEGSGIGLAICKKIAEHHGGVIFASGIAGEGAVFTLIIPA